MIESDQSNEDNESGNEMSPLNVSTDSIKSTNKRQRELSSEEETLPVKKSRKSTDEELSTSNGPKSNLVTNYTENDKQEEVKQNIKLVHTEGNASPSANAIRKDSDYMESEEEEDTKTSPQHTNNCTNNDNDSHNTSSKSDETGTSEKSVAKENVENVLEHTPKKEESANVSVTMSSTKDTEVVDGLELSVECASDKEESSSESDKDNDVKPRTKTIIVKAKPNESELDATSSEMEESGEQNLTDSLHTKKNLKQGKRKGLKSKKTSDSEGSSDSNVQDEDYKPQNKRKTKKSPVKKSTKLASDSKRGGRGARKVNPKKQEKNSNDDEEDDDDDDDKDNDVEKNDNKTVADKTMKSVDEDKDEPEHVSSENETSGSGSESDNDNPDKMRDGKRKKRGSSKPEDDKRIQSLKKYIRAAGITVKSYQDLWSGCKSNAARVRRLKSLLEEHGISGRPTLEKCKKVKEHNERLKEVSELDKSNIISEGRVTRSRRGMDPNKNSIISPDTPPRHREARSTYRRIQTVIDSDSE